MAQSWNRIGGRPSPRTRRIRQSQGVPDGAARKWAGYGLAGLLGGQDVPGGMAGAGRRMWRCLVGCVVLAHDVGADPAALGDLQAS